MLVQHSLVAGSKRYFHPITTLRTLSFGVGFKMYCPSERSSNSRVIAPACCRSLFAARTRRN